MSSRKEELTVWQRRVAAMAICSLLAVGATSLALSGTAGATAVTAAAQAPLAAAGLPGWIRAHRVALARAVVSISARTVHVTSRELVSQLRSGRSIAQVAVAHGVDPRTVAAALAHAGDAVAARAQHAGKLTPARAHAIEAALPRRAWQLVHRVF